MLRLSCVVLATLLVVGCSGPVSSVGDSDVCANAGKDSALPKGLRPFDLPQDTLESLVSAVVAELNEGATYSAVGAVFAEYGDKTYVVDIDNDTNYELLAVTHIYQATSELDFYLSNGVTVFACRNGEFFSTVIEDNWISNWSKVLAVDDFFGDGRNEVVLGGFQQTTGGACDIAVAVIGTEAGEFVDLSAELEKPACAGDAKIQDANGDGYPDIVLSGYTSGPRFGGESLVVTYISRRDGTFEVLLKEGD